MTLSPSLAAFDMAVRAAAEETLLRAVLARMRAEAWAMLMAAVAPGPASARAGIARMLARATPPEAMAAAPVAPARGPMQLVPNVVRLPGGRARVEGAHWVTADPLTVMCRLAFDRHQASGSTAPFVAPFGPGQIAMARRYAALVERHEAAGQKCASLEARPGGSGGGDGRGFIDAYLDEAAEIARIRRRIGPGATLSVRRCRPSQRGARVSIPDLVLVDAVLLHGRDLSSVLDQHGWAVSGPHRAAARAALASAMDRAQGWVGT